MQTGPLSYKVEVGPDLLWHRHIDQLRDSDLKKDPQVSTSAVLPSQLPLLTEDASPNEAETPNQVPCTSDPVAVSGKTPAITEGGPVIPAVPAESSTDTHSTRRYPTRESIPPIRLDL